MTATVTIQRRIGRNRGRARLWLEGKHLDAAGLPHGTHWRLDQTDTGLVLSKDPDGRRRIAGRPDRPVIDIVGTSLGVLAEAETVSVRYVPGSGVMVVTTA